MSFHRGLTSFDKHTTYEYTHIYLHLVVIDIINIHCKPTSPMDPMDLHPYLGTG